MYMYGPRACDRSWHTDLAEVRGPKMSGTRSPGERDDSIRRSSSRTPKVRRRGGYGRGPIPIPPVVEQGGPLV